MFNTKSMEKFNSLAGGLTSSGLTLGLTGNTTFNVASIFGQGILELSVGKDGISSRFGTGGTNIALGNLVDATKGIAESTKVLGWKYGSAEKSSTLNAVNQLSYSYDGKNNLSINASLAKDIWNGKVNVKFENLQTKDGAGDYGIYRQGSNAIIIDKSMLSNNREQTAKLATVLSHEGSHVYGNRIEAFAHLQANATYSELTDKLGLRKDSAFSNEILFGIQDKNNWKENVGNEDHWRMTWGGQLISDEDGWLRDMQGNYILDNDGKKIGAEKQESGLLNIMAGTGEQKYDSFSDEQKQQVQLLMLESGLRMDKNGQWNIELGKQLDMNTVMEISGNTIAESVFNSYYNNKVDSELANAWQLDLQFSDSSTNKIIPATAHERYSNLITTHLNDTKTPAALLDKYSWYLYTNENVATRVFKIDQNNSYLDDLIKQTNPILNTTINKYGCNYMSTIAFPQLLVGQILNAQDVQSIWINSTNSYTKWWETGEMLPNIDRKDSYVRQPDLIANLVSEKLGYSNLKFQFGGDSHRDLVGHKIQVPYSSSGHWILGDSYFSPLYNPANSIGRKIKSNPVYTWIK